MRREIQNQLEEEDGAEDTISGTYTRVHSPGWLERSIGKPNYDWDELWTKYECFIDDMENLLAGYHNEDIETTDPYLELDLEEGETEEINSREEAIQIQNMRETDSVGLKAHSWTWKPEEDLEFKVNYFDGSSVCENNAYEQVGVRAEIDDKGTMMTDDILEVMEDWFGERTEYRRAPYELH